MTTCERCNGKGWIKTEAKWFNRATCPDCDGTGHMNLAPAVSVSDDEIMLCPECNGAGGWWSSQDDNEREYTECERCKASGVIWRSEEEWW